MDKLFAILITLLVVAFVCAAGYLLGHFVLAPFAYAIGRTETWALTVLMLLVMAGALLLGRR